MKIFTKENQQKIARLPKHKDQRVAVLIDVQNMYHSAKNLYQARVNFKEVLKTATAGRKLIRALAYVVRTESGEEQGFFEALQRIGVELRIKDLQVFAGGIKKGDWDVGLAIDAIKIADKVDVVVLITGDGDFVPLIDYLKMNKGALVELIAFGKSASSRIKESADEFTDLEEEIGKYLLR